VSKQPNPPPPLRRGERPAPPPGPPNRVFKESLFGGLREATPNGLAYAAWLESLRDVTPNDPMYVAWLESLAKSGGRGVVNNIDARCLGRIAKHITQLRMEVDVLCKLIDGLAEEGK